MNNPTNRMCYQLDINIHSKKYISPLELAFGHYAGKVGFASYCHIPNVLFLDFALGHHVGKVELSFDWVLRNVNSQHLTFVDSSMLVCLLPTNVASQAFEKLVYSL